MTNYVSGQMLNPTHSHAGRGGLVVYIACVLRA